MTLTNNLTKGLTTSLTGGLLASSGSTSPFLDGVLTGVEFELDGYVAASYTSGQTWNTLPVPASGATQSKYNFNLGASTGSSTDDPSFASNTFTTDGGDHMSIADAAAIPSPLLDIATTSSGVGTFFFVLDIGSTLANNDYFFGVGFSTASVFALGTTAAGELRVLHLSADGGGTTILNVAGQFSTNTTYLVGVSVDLTATTNNVRVWANTLTKTQVSQTFGATTTAATGNATLFARPSSAGTAITQGMPNGTGLKYVAFKTGAIDDAEFALFDEYISAKHGVDYI